MNEETKKELEQIKKLVCTIAMNQTIIMKVLAADKNVSFDDEIMLLSNGMATQNQVNSIIGYREKMKEEQNKEKAQDQAKTLFDELMEVLNRKE